MTENNKIEIPIWEKTTLSIAEASAYSGIGQTKIRRMASREDCPFVLWVGHKCLIKRKPFEEYLEGLFSV